VTIMLPILSQSYEINSSTDIVTLGTRGVEGLSHAQPFMVSGVNRIFAVLFQDEIEITLLKEFILLRKVHF